PSSPPSSAAVGSTRTLHSLLPSLGVKATTSQDATSPKSSIPASASAREAQEMAAPTSPPSVCKTKTKTSTTLLGSFASCTDASKACETVREAARSSSRSGPSP
ncbi:3 -5 exoribonuclease rna-binding protein, partial [Nannochloropsis gaditana CCMP526]|uniref:3 -5 exoribonuclease rna-binding protein n=1 Tax=Nannochloropsis gaditana (strain CCMP526) TaxID=1093141 RepID=UPI00029F79F2